MLPQAAPGFGFVAAVALQEALAGFAPRPESLRLKWPNDVLLDGAKLAGVLCESALRPDGWLDWVVVGMGANLAHAPALPDRPTASLGIATPPEEVAAALLAAFDRWAATFRRDGLARVLEAWMRHGPARGARLSLTRAGRVLDGRFAGLAQDGSLLLDTEAGRLTINSGELAAGGDQADAAGR
jgi:BirA family biotin operon repressor/biotin-[acetyl-CoA-carboxylase] ligase